MSFKIADGYVEVHSRHDRARTRRNAQEAVNESDKVGRENEGRLLGWLFKTNPKLMRMLEAPIGSIFGSPIIFAAASTMMVGLVGLMATGITTALLTGVAGGFVAIAAAANRQALSGPWEKMTQDIKGVFQRASKPVVQPLINAIGMISKAFERMEPAFNRIYTALAPLIEPFTGGMLGFLEAMLPGIERAMPGIQTVVLTLAEHMPGLGTAIGDFFAHLAENGPLLERVVGLMITWLENFFKVAGPILVFWMEGFAFWADAWNKLTDGIKAGMQWLSETWAKIPGWWNESWGKVKEWFKGLGEDISGFFTSTGERISGWWDEQTGQIAGWWDRTWGSVSRWFSELPGRIGGALVNLPLTIAGYFQQAFDQVMYLLGWLLGNVVGMLLGMPTDIGNGLAQAWVAVGTWFTGALAWLTTQWTKFQTWLIAQAMAIPSRIGTFFQQMGARIVFWVMDTFNRVRNWWNQLPTMLYNAAHNGWNRVYDAFAGGGRRVEQWWNGLRDRIVTGMANLGVRLFRAGQEAIEGLVNGIASYLDWAVNRAWNAARQIAQGFIDALKIGSPSKFMEDEVGQWIPKGIMVGVDKNLGPLEKQAGMFPDLLTGARPTLGGQTPSVAPTSTMTNSGTHIEQVVFQVTLDKIQDLEDIKAFLDGKLGGTKANSWAGNIYEKTGEYERSYR